MIDTLLSNAPWVFTAVGILVGALAVIRVSGVIRYIPNDRIAVVEKLWSLGGSVKSGLIALNGEAGFQPEVLRGGFQFFFPFQYRLHIVPLVTIQQGKIGYVFARDGRPLEAGQTLASNVAASDFQNVRDFLAKGGEKGPQRKILREGTYAFNLAQFVVITEEEAYGIDIEKDKLRLFVDVQVELNERGGFSPIVIKDSEDKIGIVTVHDGPSLPPGEIIAPVVGEVHEPAKFHNNFQDPEKFLAAGGFRGRQLQVLVEGTYYINRRFATIELIEKTVVPIGFAGVVVSYTGREGTDTSGTDFTHGELVERNHRGVWKEPLLTGKYAFNAFAGKIEMVPVTNFILKWQQGQTGEHKFDQNLTEVTLITKDAFEPTLPLSVVVSIDYKKAPLVVQRFGDIKKLVEQTLDPMVSAYFKNIAQTKTLIELLQSRSEIQKQSSADMKEKFGNYNLELHEVLIGTPKGSESVQVILDQLRQRQVAIEQMTTYDRKREAAGKEKELREAESRAAKQGEITVSELEITIKENQGKASLANAKQEADVTRTRATAQADAIKYTADANAHQTQVTGAADATKEQAVGEAKGVAIKAQVEAYGGAKYRLVQEVMGRFADAIQAGHVEIVPRIMMGGSGGGVTDGAGGGTNFFATMLGALLSDKLGIGIGIGDLEAEGGRARSK